MFGSVRQSLVVLCPPTLKRQREAECHSRHYRLSFRAPLVGYSDSCLAVADLWSMAFNGSTLNEKHDVGSRRLMASSTLPDKNTDSCGSVRAALGITDVNAMPRGTNAFGRIQVLRKVQEPIDTSLSLSLRRGQRLCHMSIQPPEVLRSVRGTTISIMHCGSFIV